jgi:hypothetical protein
MEINENNAFSNNSNAQLDNNISRLVKVGECPDKPGKEFTESLIKNVLSELKKSGSGADLESSNMMVIFSQWEKVAAMIAVICSAGFGFLVYVLAQANSLFAAVVMISMLVNTFIYYGELIL